MNTRTFDSGQIDRLGQIWQGGETHINWDLRMGLRVMRSASRYLAQNDPYGRKFLRTLQKYVIGPEGYTHRNKAADYITANGQTKKKLDTTANRIIQDGFWDWSKKDYCYVTKDMSFVEGNGLEIKTIAMDGEIFIKKVYEKKTANKFGITYQLIESAYCDDRLNKVLPNGNVITMGIEHTPLRKVVAYWFIEYRPGDDLYGWNPRMYYIRIPADQIIHIYMKEYVGQMRGIPWCAPVATRLHVLKGFQEAALMNARSSARKANVLKPAKGEDVDLTADSVSGEYVTEDGGEEIIVKSIQPGETFVVPQGYDFDQYNPVWPTGSEGPFTDAILMGVSSGWDIDFPTLSSNLTGVNYTSSRHGALDSRLGWKELQRFFREHRLEPTHKDWLESAILNEAFPVLLPLSKFDKFNQPLFLGYVPEWVDKYKDVKAKILAREGLLENLEEQLAEQGKDIDEWLEAAADIREKILSKLGIDIMLQQVSLGGGNTNEGPVDSTKSELTDEMRETIEELVEETMDNYKSNGKH
jgi:lambda family phage portal protein